MIAAFVLSLAMSTTMVPPGEPVVNHAHPAHFAQPTIRVFERRAEDTDRKLAWVNYCRDLDQLWSEYSRRRQHTRGLARLCGRRRPGQTPLCLRRSVLGPDCR